MKRTFQAVLSVYCSAVGRNGCRYDVPLVADIHFQPKVAMLVADAFEKIRINPGNFADGRKTFEVINYEDPAQFKKEQEEIREVCCPSHRHGCPGLNSPLFHGPSSAIFLLSRSVNFSNQMD